jgi:hypothetical protein
MKDCRIDSYRDGSRSLYHRATHIPTGTVVEQDGAAAWGIAGRWRIISALQKAVADLQKPRQE